MSSVRFTLTHGRSAVIVVAVVAVFVAGCGGDSEEPTKPAISVAANSPAYCHQFATMPANFSTAVSNAASGVASDEDKKTVDAVASQFREALKDDQMPDHIRSEVTNAVTLLDKLSKGETITQTQAVNFAKTFTAIGKAVVAACAGS